ncbi:MAG TPA: hypothetical protein VFW65_21015 [Pseudonocardiaceae bacterium]|nr:hypothetical protein [Pseudonocardiaceae bacterium]
MLAGVGTTALGVAAVRTHESGRPDRLFDDPFVAAVPGGLGDGLDRVRVFEVDLDWLRERGWRPTAHALGDPATNYSNPLRRPAASSLLEAVRDD